MTQIPEFGPFEWPLSFDQSKKKKKKPKPTKGYDNTIVFAVDSIPNAVVSSDGWVWRQLGPLAFTGDPAVTFISSGGYKRDIGTIPPTGAFYLSGSKGFFDGATFQVTDVNMSSVDGVSWGSAGSAPPSSLYAYSAQSKQRSVNGFVYRVAGDGVSNVSSRWGVADGTRFLSPKYARFGGTEIQRCANINAKEDDETQVWETILSTTGRYTGFGPLTVIKGDSTTSVPTVVCVVSTNDDNDKFAILSSRDGVDFTETFTGPTIITGGSDIVTFSSGHV